ncbi:hypothetical protein J3E69DRAFT_350708 [Trichoderma sp. SZMC 28015]
MDVFLVLSAFFDSAFRPVYPIFSLLYQFFLFCLASSLPIRTQVTDTASSARYVAVVVGFPLFYILSVAVIF